jgi:hypothetical protein
LDKIGDTIPPYEQRWVMRSDGLLSLARALPAVERYA